MAMSIYAAWEDQLSRCINIASPIRKVPAERNNLAIANRDIGRRDTFGSRKASAFDDQIIHGRWPPRSLGLASGSILILSAI